MDTPVTVSVRRETTPSRTGDAVAWIDEGLALAREFEGCLGGGVIRDAENENVVHVVYRFRDDQALERWEQSEARQQWLRDGDPLILEANIQRRTGIEGWFDGPELRRTLDDTGSIRTIGVRSAPLRWKQAVAIWLGMFPLNLAVSWLISYLPWWVDLSQVARSALIVSVMVPVMTFFMMPLVTRALRTWLRRSAGTIKSERALLEALNSRARR